MKLSISVAIALQLSYVVDAQNDIRLINPKASSVYDQKNYGKPEAPLERAPKFSGTWPGTCYHSDEIEPNHIWQAEFENGPTQVTSVEILARKDCCDHRVDGVQVFVGDTECGAVQSAGKDKWVEV